MKQPATDLVLERFASAIREGSRSGVAAFLDEYFRSYLLLEVDAAAIETRRRSSLQTTNFKTEPAD